MVEVSVIIPTYNRGEALAETIAALAANDYLHWEAIIVDDGSTDDTETIVRRSIARARAPIRYMRQKNAGPAAARNRGAQEARGSILIFIDNDIIVEPDFIRLHVESLKAHSGCWIVGRVTHPPELRRTPFGRYRHALWESFHESQNTYSIAETDGITAANLSLPASDFHRFGGFDESFTIASSEDWELGRRARQAGIRILYHPDIVVLHNDWAISLEKFCERQRLYSISDVLLWRKYGAASPRTQLVSENAPVQWRQDKPRVVAKKIVKAGLVTTGGQLLVKNLCYMTELLAPDSLWNHRAYNLAVATAIFRGVREGFKRYPEAVHGL